MRQQLPVTSSSRTSPSDAELLGMRRVRVATLFGLFAAASLAVLLGSLVFGSVPISLSEVLQTIV